MAKTVVGLFDDIANADSVVGDLIDKGASREHISVVRTGSDSFAENFTSGNSGTTASGAAVGGFNSPVGSLFSGTKTVQLAGIGPVYAAGPLRKALTAPGPHANHTLIQELTERGVAIEDAAFYAEGVRRGSTLVLLRIHDEDADDVVDIMQAHGAVDINERSTHWKNRGWKSFDTNGTGLTREEFDREREACRTGLSATSQTTAKTAGPLPKATENTGEITLPVVEEELHVGKRQVQGGGVRLVQEVRERPVEEVIRLREEKIRVERRPVDRAISSADVENLTNRAFDITETKEEAVVAKTARVKEEVVISKDAQIREETVRDSVRSTDVRVEKDPAPPKSSSLKKK